MKRENLTYDEYIEKYQNVENEEIECGIMNDEDYDVNKWGGYSINRGDDDEEDDSDQNNLHCYILPDNKIQSILHKFPGRVVID